MAGPPDLPGKEDIKQLPSGPVDLSPAVTTVAFETVLPLLRVPLPAGEDDDPHKGPYVLAFKDEDSWRRAWRRCEDKVAAQCEFCALTLQFFQTGARMGCSISAANICKPPWWKTMLPFYKISAAEESEREACEEREMMACLAASKESCIKYAQGTCEPVFAELRIANPEQVIDPRFNGKKPPRLRRPPGLQRPNSVHKAGERSPGAKLAEARASLEQVHKQTEKKKRSTNFRGRRLMEEGGSHTRAWEGPIWSDAEEDADIAVPKEPIIEGWEGGLVRPKFDSRKSEQAEQPEQLPEVGMVPSFWETLHLKIGSKLKELGST